LFVRAEAPDLGRILVDGEKHDSIFFDDRETSETYTQRITSCRACGQQLERKNVEAVTYPA
jgi:hypothetical protein